MNDTRDNSVDAQLNLVFYALSDPVRRAVLTRLHHGEMLVSELAAPFDISLQAVSKHIQVLVKAGLVTQQRSGRVNRCQLQAGPIYVAAVWINQYSKYWDTQFDVLAAALAGLDEAENSPAQMKGKPKVKSAAQTKGKAKGKTKKGTKRKRR